MLLCGAKLFSGRWIFMDMRQYGPIILQGYREFYGDWNYYSFDNINCYDVSHRYLMVSRNLELMLYRIVGVTKNFFEFWHERGTWWYEWYLRNTILKFAWSWHLVWFNYRTSMEKYFRFEISAISLGCDLESYFKKFRGYNGYRRKTLIV